LPFGGRDGDEGFGKRSEEAHESVEPWRRIAVALKISISKSSLDFKIARAVC